MSQKLQDLKDQLKAGNPPSIEDVKATFNELTCFKDIFLLKRIFDRSEKTNGPSGKEIKVAIIGGVTLYPLYDLLQFYFNLSGKNYKLFIGEYKNYYEEILNPESELYQFAPSVVLFIPENPTEKVSNQGLQTWQDFDQRIKHHVDGIVKLCDTLSTTQACDIIVCNSVSSAHPGFGHIRGRMPGTEWTIVREYNSQLARTLKSEYFLCDLDFLASRSGLKSTFDERFWLDSKNIFSPDFIVEIAKELGRLVESLKSPMKKCLILDLDNTLWGGVIGDDGIEGIELGELSSKGFAFKRFQQSIKKLKDIGVILCIASKNEISVVLEALNTHPDMVLRESDFVCIKANWEPKSENIRLMAKELNLGLDSFVFVDDNPSEIEIVKRYLPEVTTVLLGPDPATYIDQLSDLRLFEPAHVSEEDKNKTEQYQVESLRAQEFSTFTNMDEYLESLKMEIEFSDFNEFNLPRVVQLINKSNQFNLTTRRRTETELKSLIENGKFSGIAVKVKDKFGDYGLISVVIINNSRGQNTAEIDTWIMSCRVLKRQVEEEVLNKVVELCKSNNIKKIEGLYIPTKKNMIVKDHFSNLGFSTVTTEPEQTKYLLSTEEFTPIKTYLKNKGMFDEKHV